MKQALHISWDDIHEASKKLAASLQDAGPWQGIIGVSRSGMIPATIVAMELNIRLLDSICIASYNGSVQRKAEILKMPNSPDVKNGKGWIVIDDLVDTGQTAQLLKQVLPEAKLATLYAKPQGKPHADYFIAETGQETWVYFPWDAKTDAAV